MRARPRGFTLTLLFAGLVSSAAIGACYHHHDYDYVAVRWSVGEEPYYERWEHETHRDHRDWDQRNGDEQRAYWQWRHDHQS